jgi:hypothetical protein
VWRLRDRGADSGSIKGPLARADQEPFGVPEPITQQIANSHAIRLSDDQAPYDIPDHLSYGVSVDTEPLGGAIICSHG